MVGWKADTRKREILDFGSALKDKVVNCLKTVGGKFYKINRIGNTLKIVVRCKVAYQKLKWLSADGMHCKASLDHDKLFVQLLILDDDGIPENEIMKVDRCSNNKEIYIYEFSDLAEKNFMFELLDANKPICFE